MNEGTNRRGRGGLGRGLGALLGDVAQDVAGTPDSNGSAGAGVRMIPVSALSPHPDQPRRRFDEAALEELAASIAEHGIVQPIIVRPHGHDYQIVAGERRWRAAQQAQLHELPVIIRDLSDTEVLEIALIENIQRADLNAIEEAASFRQLMDRFGHTQEQLAEALNKSRSHIANLLRLLNLPEQVQIWLKEGKLSAGHARALVPAPNAAQLARRVIERGLSVRETEKLVRDLINPPAAKPANRRAGEKDADTRVLESDLSAHLKMRVAINHAANADGGQLVVTYKDLDQLDRLCQVLGGSA